VPWYVFDFSSTLNVFPVFYFIFFLQPSKMVNLSFIWIKGRKEFKISRGFEGFLMLTSFHKTSSFCDIISAVNGFTSTRFSII